MLPSGSEPRSSITAVLPSLLDAVQQTPRRTSDLDADALSFPHVSAAVLVVVDGLGQSNLQHMRGHARFLSLADQLTLETVVPTTTGAALSSLMTGTMPGQHGLVGYQIRDERDGRLRSTLSDWQGLGDSARWQRSPALLDAAQREGLRPMAIGRRAHQGSGLSLSILRGAEYHSADTIEQRFAAASEALSRGSRLVYLYVDELDRAAHAHGWQSDDWMHALEELDAQVRSFVARLPADVGCVVTADHGVIDVPREQHVLMNERMGLLEGVEQVGGEPRMRYLYLSHDGLASVDTLVERWRSEEGHRAEIFTRQSAIRTGMFGTVDDDISSRLGDVIIAALGPVAYYTSWPEDEASRRMIGQHGGVSAEEREIPLIRLGAFSRATQF